MAPRKAGRRRDTCVEEQKLVAAKKSWLCCLDLMINQGGSLHMKYKNANTILPEELVKELQKYIQGVNPDKVELEADEKSCWEGLMKIKKMSWRAVE